MPVDVKVLEGCKGQQMMKLEGNIARLLKEYL